MGEEISLMDLFGIIKKRMLMIVSLGLVGLILSSVVTFFIATPQYSSSTQLLVNRTQTGELIQQSDIDTNLQLINTYKDIIKGPVILDDVRETLDLNLSHSQLSNKIEIGNQDNSQVFSLTITADDPFDAATIANTVANTFQENIDDIMNVDNVTIISEATANISPVSPNTVVNLAIGLLVGVIIGVALAFVYEFMDNTVKDEKFIIEELKWTNLGKVSEMSEDELKAEQHSPQLKVESRSARSRV